MAIHYSILLLLGVLNVPGKTRGGPLGTVYACLLGEIVFEETIDKQKLMDLK